jgi:hypothetical protein
LVVSLFMLGFFNNNLLRLISRYTVPCMIHTVRREILQEDKAT